MACLYDGLCLSSAIGISFSITTVRMCGTSYQNVWADFRAEPGVGYRGESLG